MIPPGHKSLTCGLDPQDFYPGGLEEYTHTHACTHASMHARSTSTAIKQAPAANTLSLHQSPSCPSVPPLYSRSVLSEHPPRMPNQ